MQTGFAGFAALETGFARDGIRQRQDPPRRDSPMEIRPDGIRPDGIWDSPDGIRQSINGICPARLARRVSPDTGFARVSSFCPMRFAGACFAKFWDRSETRGALYAFSDVCVLARS
jgi:hypothetical protein